MSKRPCVCLQTLLLGDLMPSLELPDMPLSFLPRLSATTNCPSTEALPCLGWDPFMQ